MARNETDDWEDVPVEVSDDDWEDVPMPNPPVDKGVGDAVMRGVAQGSTLGFADELTAGLGALKDVAAAKLGLRGDISLGDAYESYLPHIRGADDRAQEQHPVAYGGGEIGGALAASVVAPGLNAGRAPTALGRVGRAAAEGVITGAGHSRESLANNPLGVAQDAAIGGLVAGGSQAGIDKLVSKAAPLVKRGADFISEKINDAGGLLKTRGAEMASKAAGLGADEAAGRQLLDDGIVQFGDSVKDIAAKSKASSDATGRQIGELLKEIDDDATSHFISSGGEGSALLVDGTKMADRLRAHADDIAGSGNKGLVKELRAAADDLEARGWMSFADAAKEKKSWRSGPTMPKQSVRTIRGIISDEMEQGVARYEREFAERGITQAEPMEQVGSQFGEMLKTGSGRSVPSGRPPLEPMLGEAQAAEGALDAGKRLELYRQLKEKYGAQKQAADASAKIANRSGRNQSISLGDKVAAIAGAAASGPQGIVLGAANKLLRHRGTSAGAVTLDKIGDMVRRTPERFGRYAAQLQEAASRGDHALAVTHFVLMSQNPDYRQQVSDEE